jgi:anti-sigma factor RsiW
VNCDRARQLLHPYLDRELAAPERRGVEEHLHTCVTCAAESARLEEVIDTVKAGGRHRLPPRLPSRVRAALAADVLRRATGPSWWWLWQLAPPLAAAAFGFWIALTFFAGWSEREVALREVVAAHVRSLMESNLLHVASADPHTVKPWFAGRIDFAADVQDLTRRGFDLIGARRDYLQQRPAAALVYRRREHVINLFVVPAGPEAEPLPAEHSHHGYHIVQWRQGDLAYWAISDLNMSELEAFARLAGASPEVMSR